MHRGDLEALLDRIDGRSYGAYKALGPAYELDGFELRVDHVQGDPFAAPSRFAVRVPHPRAAFDPDLWSTRVRRLALCDFLCRRFSEVADSIASRRGSGRSGALEMTRPGQQVLERSAVSIDGEAVEARFVAGLPARGRRILGRQASALLLTDVGRVVERSLLRSALDREALERHVRLAEDSVALRGLLPAAGLVAFVADGAILPRQSGVDDRPLPRGAVPFRSPDSLRVSFTLPNAGSVTGMGVPEGVTLIVGGGYHGKSTVLRALERGVGDHVPGDGRELVVALPGAVKVRAEDGRPVTGVDISPFIDRLPMGRDTVRFETEDASGSTSQAASIVEAVEVGAQVLLLDEDTSATNFLIRDRRMQALIRKESEPITPLLDKVRQLHQEHGVSTVLVMGGSGDYFDVADTVIALDAYEPWDATDAARQIAASSGPERAREGGERFGPLRPRAPEPRSVDPRRGKREVSLRSRGLRSLEFGENEIDLTGLEQLVEEGQVRALGRGLDRLRRGLLDGRTSLAAALTRLEAEIEEVGLDALGGPRSGDLVGFRRFELAGALNRLRALRVEPAEL